MNSVQVMSPLFLVRFQVTRPAHAMPSLIEDTTPLIDNGGDSGIIANGRPDVAIHRNSRTPISRKQYVAAVVILFIELAERMTFYGLVCNLVLLSTTEMKYSSVDAVTINLVFQSE